MAVVLVTGGTGVLGREAVPALRAAGHEVRVLSRRPGEGRLVGDLRTGEGVGEGVTGAEVVVHLASAPREDPWAVDVGGTGRLAVAAREAGASHLLYVSIPGVDRIPYSYYRAKYAAEQIVAAGAVPHTVLRVTQFHPFVATLLDFAHRAGMLPVPAGWRVQPVDVPDVAVHLVERVAGGPTGRVVELGGPQTREVADLARSWLAARGTRGRLVPVPVPGRMSRAIRSGRSLVAPDAPRGTTTWEQWLARTGGRSPYRRGATSGRASQKVGRVSMRS